MLNCIYLNSITSELIEFSSGVSVKEDKLDEINLMLEMSETDKLQTDDTNDDLVATRLSKLSEHEFELRVFPIPIAY